MSGQKDGNSDVAERLRHAGVPLTGPPSADLIVLVEALDRMARTVEEANVGNAEPAIAYAMWLEENDEPH